MSDLLTVRPEVAQFASDMEAALRRHDATKGRRSWVNTDPQRSYRRLQEKVQLLGQVLGGSSLSVEDRRILAADIANLSLIVLGCCGCLEGSERYETDHDFSLVPFQETPLAELKQALQDLETGPAR